MSYARYSGNSPLSSICRLRPIWTPIWTWRNSSGIWPFMSFSGRRIWHRLPMSKLWNLRNPSWNCVLTWSGNTGKATASQPLWMEKVLPPGRPCFISTAFLKSRRLSKRTGSHRKKRPLSVQPRLIIFGNWIIFPEKRAWNSGSEISHKEESHIKCSLSVPQLYI